MNIFMNLFIFLIQWRPLLDYFIQNVKSLFLFTPLFLFLSLSLSLLSLFGSGLIDHITICPLHQELFIFGVFLIPFHAEFRAILQSLLRQSQMRQQIKQSWETLLYSRESQNLLFGTQKLENKAA